MSGASRSWWTAGVVEKVLRFDDQAYPMTCRLGARGPQSLQGMNEPDPIGGGLETRSDLDLESYSLLPCVGVGNGKVRLLKAFVYDIGANSCLAHHVTVSRSASREH